MYKTVQYNKVYYISLPCPSQDYTTLYYTTKDATLLYYTLQYAPLHDPTLQKHQYRGVHPFKAQKSKIL